MSAETIVTAAGVAPKLNPGTSATLTFDFEDASGDPLVKASLLTLEATLQDAVTGEIINSRINQTVKDANGGTVAADGTLTLILGPSDSPVVNPEDERSRYESHYLTLTWTWNDGVNGHTNSKTYELVYFVGLGAPGGVGLILKPVTNNGAIRSPLVIGDAYVSPDREFTWRIDKPALTQSTSAARFRSWPAVCEECAANTDEIFDVGGTITESTVSGETVWDVGFDLGAADSRDITPGEFAWSAYVEQGTYLSRLSPTLHPSSLADLRGTSDGTLVGAAISSAQAGDKYSIDFGGDDYVDLANPSLLTTSGDAWSISMWVKRDSGIAASEYLYGATNADASEFAWLLLQSSGIPQAKVCGASGDVSTDGMTDVTDGEWHHIAATFDGSTLNLYVDGADDAGGGSGTGSPSGADPSKEAILGAKWGSGGADVTPKRNFLTGSIDDVMIWTSAVLAAGEVSTIHSGGRGGYSQRITFAHSSDHGTVDWVCG